MKNKIYQKPQIKEKKLRLFLKKFRYNYDEEILLAGTNCLCVGKYCR